MYSPKPFRMEELSAQVDFMRAHPFALLVTSGANGLCATHLPVILHEEQDTLRIVGHIARANPQWREFDGEVMVVFQGPHAYVSPRWYEHREENVPTWNYMAVHAYGQASAFEDRQDLEAMLDELSGHYETAPDGWRFNELDSAPRENLVSAIIGIRIDVSRIDGKAKLSQNKSAADRDGVISGLTSEGHHALAEAMRHGRTPPTPS